jgi:hypothetical protein
MTVEKSTTVTREEWDMKKTVWYLSSAAMGLASFVLVAWVALAMAARLFGYEPTHVYIDLFGTFLIVSVAALVWWVIAAWLTGGLLTPEQRGWK